MHRLFHIMPTGLTIGALVRLGLVIVCALWMVAGRAAMAQDTFSRLLAGSISLTFFFYIFVKIHLLSV